MFYPANLSLALPYMLAAFAFGYLLGSIPFGLILTRLAGTTDIRSIGSGSIGATNVLRTGRKGLAAATVLCDMLKGTAAVVIVDRLWGRDMAIIAAFGALLGHLFPLWLKFKGGKGVATYIGILLGLYWPAVLAFGGIWLTVAFATRYSSLAGLTASAATPIFLWFMDERQLAQLFIVLTLFVWVMHRTNMARLLAGTEGKIGKKAETVSPPG